MATRASVPVYPPTLRWARESIGLTPTQAAAKMRVPIEQIVAWESSAQSLTLTSAKKLAAIYKVSLPLLYLQTIPAEWQQQKPIDFRRTDKQQPYSYQLCCAIREARERQLWMRTYLQNAAADTVATGALEWVGSFAQQNNAKTIAAWLVQWLDIDRAHIADLKDAKAALEYWIDRVEAKRVIVASNRTHAAHKISSEEYSGLVLYDDYAPLILLNPADSPPRRIFTLMHELAHLLLNNASGVSQIDFRQPNDYDSVESLCNRIASTVLLDADALIEVYASTPDTTQAIEKLAFHFKLSRSAIAVQLKVLDLIDQTDLDELLKHYQYLYTQAAKHKPAGGRVVPHKQVLDRCGKLLTKSVLAAYAQGSISATEIYDVLGIKLKYLGDLSNRLQFPLHRWAKSGLLVSPCRDILSTAKLT